MVSRCSSPSNPNFKYYGAEGVSVCDRWVISKGGSFENFLNDMGPKPEGKWLDKDKIGDGKLYSPKTCCWLSPKEQMEYRRSRKASLLYEYRGKSLCVRELSEMSGVSVHRIRQRIQRGWSAEKAANTPVRKQSRNS